MVIYYRKLTNGDDALFNNVKISNDSIPICLERQGKDLNKPDKFFAEFRSSYQLLKEIANTSIMERCYFEVIRGNHSQKHYVDIDMKLIDDKFTEKFPHSIEEKINIAENICEEYISALLKIKSEIKRSDILIFNSHADCKRSFHIVVDRWFFPSATQNKELFMECMEHIPLPHRKYFDDKMYKSVQQFRILFSTKCGKNRFKKLDKNSTWKYEEQLNSDEKKLRELFYASLITEIACCTMLSFEYKNKTEFVSSKYLDNNEVSVVHQHFKNFKDSNKFEFGEPKNSTIPLRRKAPSYCEVCQREHESENPYLYVSFDNKLYFNCRRNDKSQFVSDLTTNDEGVIINDNNTNNNSVYIPPTISYNVKVTEFGDNGILNLSNSGVSGSNSYPHLDELITNNEQKEILPIPPQNPIINRKIIVTNNEKSEYCKTIEEAKLRHTYRPIQKESVISRLNKIIYK